MKGLTQRECLGYVGFFAPVAHRLVQRETTASAGLAGKLVGGAEFESATPWMSTKYSNQLN